MSVPSTESTIPMRTDRGSPDEAIPTVEVAQTARLHIRPVTFRAFPDSLWTQRETPFAEPSARTSQRRGRFLLVSTLYGLPSLPSMPALCYSTPMEKPLETGRQYPVKASAYFTPEMYARVRKRAYQEERSTADLIRAALEQYLALGR